MHLHNSTFSKSLATAGHQVEPKILTSTSCFIKDKLTSKMRQQGSRLFHCRVNSARERMQKLERMQKRLK